MYFPTKEFKKCKRSVFGKYSQEEASRKSGQSAGSISGACCQTTVVCLCRLHFVDNVGIINTRFPQRFTRAFWSVLLIFHWNIAKYMALFYF